MFFEEEFPCRRRIFDVDVLLSFGRGGLLEDAQLIAERVEGFDDDDTMEKPVGGEMPLELANGGAENCLEKCGYVWREAVTS